MAKRSDPTGNDKPIHLVMMGRPGAGKTTLRNTILTGKSIGDPGPNAGTIKFDNSPNATIEKNGVRYIVHDTPGIDVNSDLSFIKDEIDANLLNQHCIVVLCIKWNDRILDADKKVLKLVNSFSNDIWNKVLIALTHSDKKPDDIKTDENEYNEVWHETIKEEIRKLGVSDDTLKQLNICNTSRIGEACLFKDWLINFIMKLANTLPTNLSEHIVSGYEKCIPDGGDVGASYDKYITGGVVGAFGGVAVGTLVKYYGIASLGGISGFIGSAVGGAVLGVIVVAAYIKFYQEKKEKEE